VTVADTLICSVKLLAVPCEPKLIDLAGHWLVQHTAPFSTELDSRPRLEWAHYKYPTSC